MSEFEISLGLWGYHVHRGAGDVSTIISEYHDPSWTNRPVWDQDSRYLDTVTLNGERPPERFALWWVCEHERRMDY